MTEIIFGLGSHSTLFDVISTALTEIEEVFGAPREIVANAPGIRRSASSNGRVFGPPIRFN